MKQIGSHHTLGYMSPPEAGNMEHAKVEDCDSFPMLYVEFPTSNQLNFIITI